MKTAILLLVSGVAVAFGSTGFIIAQVSPTNLDPAGDVQVDLIDRILGPLGALALAVAVIVVLVRWIHRLQARLEEAQKSQLDELRRQLELERNRNRP